MGFIAAQAIDAGMREPGTGSWLFCPAQSDSFFAGRIGQQLDIIVLRYPLGVGLEAPDPFMQLD